MADELFSLDGLPLNGSGLVAEEVDLTPPAKRVEWAQGADSDGSALVRDPLFELREITLKLRVERTATMALAATRIAGLSRKLEECEQNPDGLPLVWTPADGSAPSLTFYVLTGAVTELPIAQGGDSGYFVNSPTVTVKLSCKPFGYGDEVTVAGVSSTAPVLTLTVPNVPGDVPAEGRLIVTDAASKDRRTVEWGLEQRNYNAASPAPLVIDSDTLVTTGYAGTGTVRTGAYDPDSAGNNAITATLGATTTAICGIANQAHIGTYRVRARVSTPVVVGVRVRLAWQDGDGPLGTNAYATIPIGGWFEVDLGVITIKPAVLGNQKWAGRLEGLQGTNGNQLFVDYLTLIPVAEGYGKARGQTVTQPGVISASDSFSSVTDLAVLNARAAEAGGSWATSGATTDFFQKAVPADGSSSRVERTTTADAAPRFAILGTATFTDCMISGSVAQAQPGQYGLIARWVDASNYLVLQFNRPSSSPNKFFTIELVQVVAGASSLLASTARILESSPSNALGLTVSSSGGFVATLDGAQVLTGSASALATGGTLASGKPGILDRNVSGGGIRGYDAIVVQTIPTSPPALYSGRAVEFRSDGSAIRQDSTGTYYGAVPSYRGGRFVIPPAGDKNRTARIAVTAHRNDLSVAPNEPLGDNLTVSVAYRPRWVVVRG